MNFSTALAALEVRPLVGWTHFDGTDVLSSDFLSMTNGETTHAFGGATWKASQQVESLGDGSFDWRVRLEVCEGSAAACAVSVGFDFQNWSTTNYVLMPAAAYNGNRFHAVKSNRVEGVAEPSAVMPLTISDQERLAIAPGPSRLEFRAGDLATPAVGIHIPSARMGLLVLTEPDTALGLVGIALEESADRSRAALQLGAPCVRWGEKGRIKGDRAADWEVGSTVEFRLRVHLFHAPEINDLFETYFSRRGELAQTQARHDVPFSHCWEVQQEKYNQQNWVEELGYYSVGMRESRSQDWQTAWVGGLNTVYPLLCEGNEQTRQRAARTFDFLFPNALAPSGFLRESCYHGDWTGSHPPLMRHSADGLLFLMKEYALLEARGEEVKPQWKEAARGVAEAFCKLWHTHGQFGHRIDAQTGVLVFGGTCSASTAPAGLALAARYFNEPRYLAVARAAAQHYHRDYVSRGISNGGPGDMLQCPDSESAAGLLESFVTLWEETGEQQWLRFARDAAHHCATWTMTYDFVFPPDSTFGKMEMLTTGTVWANIQNKHSAPGICSLSGNSLLKLFRGTEDARYLDLLRDIAHAIPQYMSRADRPICDVRPNQTWPIMPPGWINERVNTSDWEVRGDPQNNIGVGEIFGGSTWSEVAMLLTFAEVPGIYAQPDTGFLCALDHVEASWKAGQGERRTLEIHNPTPFAASVKLLIENSTQLAHPLGPIAGANWPRVEVAAGETVWFEMP